MTEPKQSIADNLGVKPHDEGFGASLDRAAGMVPVAGEAYKSIKSTAQAIGDVDGISDLDDAAKQMAGSGASFIGGAYADAAMFTMDPIGYLVGAGLNMLLELVQPLQDALHYVSGDGPSIGQASDNFGQIGQGFVALAEDFQDTGDKALTEWKEEAANAAREALADFSTGIKGVGSAAGSVAEVLKIWSMIMVVIEEVIKGIITELVSWLITLWLPALAASVISFGSSVAAAMTASVAKVASVFTKVSKHLGKLGKLLDELGKFLVKFNGGVLKLTEKFRLGKTLQKGQRSVPVVGKPSDMTKFVPSRRVAATYSGEVAKGIDNAAGAMVGNYEARIGNMFSREALTDLATGAGIKAGVGVGKGAGKEAQDSYEDAQRDEPIFDKSAIGGDQDLDDTRDNLQM